MSKLGLTTPYDAPPDKCLLISLNFHWGQKYTDLCKVERCWNSTSKIKIHDLLCLLINKLHQLK